MLVTKQASKDQPNRALILAGGGMRVAYQSGVMKAMEEEGLVFCHTDGASGGIFNAAMLASGYPVENIMEKWKTLNFNHFTSFIKLKEYFRPWNLRALGDADGIRDKVLPHFGVNAENINKLNLPVTFSVCNFTKKKVEAIPTDQVEENHLLAGVSLPILMPALKVKNDWLIDAVWIKDANLLEAVKKGAEDLWLIWGIGNYPSYLSGSLNQYVHSIEMSANGALFEEFEQIKWINKLIELGHSPYGQIRKIKVFVVKPKLPLPLDPELFLKKLTARALINMGYQNAKNYFKELPENGDALDFSATQTIDSGDYLCLPMEFSGEILEGTKSHQVIFYLFLRLSHSDEFKILEAFSSLCFVENGEEMIGGETLVEMVKSVEGNDSIAIETALQGKSATYVLKTKLRCSGPRYWLLGLAFKSIDLKLFSPLEKNDLMAGTLYQSFVSRLKGVILSLAKKRNGTNAGIAFKYRMLQKLLKNEV
ncbi:patatin-like phospholipase family protein [Cyclobacterium marinum]|uniref:Patatin n=1 Tax=Cyclobacterium marinum (strain ATCC 25205 / DSM 745 / LMG 13164 / NCIMB 1802) TaxID=880070 RepID=G0IXT5_CYCMS|nr:patatin-like phospholipase family protein [Cyclobacterium marinum]AEL28082.1 Patatin [Cyclobacterium marinum DSM 745]